ncbi:hypothetical protein OS493_017134 [Desmophyllum pertusum]|uniref:Uncharacterized protein n=1 Tax=Desmophyllum pertusum TaxID=174260 RepID=A0A9W9YFR2_9CNID|nr:hypothetical protein OS493_017134 [Desmophyllum pertusum]
MDNEAHRDSNNLETVVTSQPLLLIIEEINTQSSEHSIEDGTYSRCTDILASGTLFRFITKATGLWNPRKKRHALFCAFFVVLNILSLLAEILIPNLCGPLSIVAQVSQVQRTWQMRQVDQQWIP